MDYLETSGKSRQGRTCLTTPNQESVPKIIPFLNVYLNFENQDDRLILFKNTANRIILQFDWLRAFGL